MLSSLLVGIALVASTPSANMTVAEKNAWCGDMADLVIFYSKKEIAAHVELLDLYEGGEKLDRRQLASKLSAYAEISNQREFFELVYKKHGCKAFE